LVTDPLDVLGFGTGAPAAPAVAQRMLAWLTKSSIICGVRVGDSAAAVGDERELVAGAVEVEALPHPARTITNDAETTVSPGSALKRRRLIPPNCTTAISLPSARAS
jgi:hypothetical protein